METVKKGTKFYRYIREGTAMEEFPSKPGYFWTAKQREKPQGKITGYFEYTVKEDFVVMDMGDAGVQGSIDKFNGKAVAQMLDWSSNPSLEDELLPRIFTKWPIINGMVLHRSPVEYVFRCQSELFEEEVQWFGDD